MDKSKNPYRRKEKALHSNSTSKEMRKAQRIKSEHELDEALENTFPASDATAKY